MGVYSRKKEITYMKYIIWVTIEIISMSLFYAIFSYYIARSGPNRDFYEIFQKSVINTSLVILLPYSMAWLYFSWKEKTRELESLQKTDGASETDIPKKGIIAFHDEKGELKISIMLENLLYLESSDNYITIHYLNKEKIVHFIVRNTLKWMDENITADLPLVRCHRSFMVNLDRVKVLKKGKEGIILELDALNTPDLPVSKTYYEKVMRKFSAYSL